MTEKGRRMAKTVAHTRVAYEGKFLSFNILWAMSRNCGVPLGFPDPRIACPQRRRWSCRVRIVDFFADRRDCHAFL